MASRNPRSDELAAWLARQRWFAQKTRRITTLTVDDRVSFDDATLLVVTVDLDDGSRDTYAVPVRAGDEIVDALDDPAFGRALLALIAQNGRIPGLRGELEGHRTHAFPSDLPADLTVRRLGAEQSNTSIAFGDRLILKHFRRLADGPNPEQEITRFLTERAGFANAPRLAGHLEYHHDGGVAMLAVLQEMIAGARDGWEWMLDELRSFYERARSSAPTEARLLAIAGTTVDAFHRLGQLTAELHWALASDASEAAFAPEPITPSDIGAWADAVERRLRDAQAVLGDVSLPSIPELQRGLRGLVGRQKIRHHGDYHLGQTLHRPRDGDFVIIDFEGEPLRPLAERRLKHAALRDVAGMLRSIDYAAVAAMSPGLDEWAHRWQGAATAAFVGAYRSVTRGSGFVPSSDDAFTKAVAVFELEKAAYEVVYEANHRPTWLAIPARGLRRAAAALAGTGEAGEA